MRGFLIDTNVASEVKKGARANPVTRAWFDATHPNDIYVSVLVFGEIRKGIELRRLKDPAQAIAIENWSRNFKRDCGPRILPVTLAIAEEWG